MKMVLMFVRNKNIVDIFLFVLPRTPRPRVGHNPNSIFFYNQTTMSELGDFHKTLETQTLKKIFEFIFRFRVEKPVTHRRPKKTYFTAAIKPLPFEFYTVHVSFFGHRVKRVSKPEFLIFFYPHFFESLDNL